MSVTNWIIKAFQEGRYPITETRSEVARYLVSHCGMFSVESILKERGALDRVSVYRTLGTLLALDVIHPTVVLGRHQLYEVHHPKKHHHHAVCTECEESRCRSCPIEEKKAATHHTLFYSSVCARCQTIS